MSAVDYAPPTSVDRGADFTPPAMSNGGTAGIAGRLALTYRSPDTYQVDVLWVDTPPDAAKNQGKLMITGDGDNEVLSFSDGTAWRSLKLGAII